MLKVKKGDTYYRGISELTQQYSIVVFLIFNWRSVCKSISFIFFIAAANAGYAANGSEMDTIRRSLNLCALAGVSATDRK